MFKAFVLSCLLATCVHAQIVEDFCSGDRDPARAQFPGEAGNGWLTAWIVVPNSGAGGSEEILSPKHPEYLPFGDGSQSYLRLIGKKKPGIRDSAQRAVVRQYGDFGVLATARPHQISFQLRLDEGTADLLEFTIFDSTRSAVGPVAGRSTWAIRGIQGGNWEFIDKVAGRFVDSGMPLVEGALYEFHVQLDPSQNRYRVLLKDTTHQRQVQSEYLRFVRKAGAVGGWLGWAMKLQPGGSTTASLSAIEIAPAQAH